MTTVAEAAYLLKTVYLSNDQIEQFAEDCILYKLFKKDNRWVSKVGAGQGNTTNTPAAYGMQWPIEDVRNTRVGMYSLSNPQLIPPDGRQGAQAFVSLAASHAGVLLDAILFAAAKDEDQVFENVATRNMKVIFEDLQNFESRVMWGNGNGALGTIASVNTGTGVVTLATNTAGSFLPLTKFIQPQQYITILSPTGTDRSLDGVLVSATSDVNGTFTIPTTNTTNIVAGDVVVNYQSWVAGASAGIEPIGLTGMYGNNSTLFGINPSSHSKWIPATIVTNNTDPTENFLEQLKAYMAIGGQKPDVMVTHPLVVSKYGSSLLQYKRLVNKNVIPGGQENYEDAQSIEGPEYLGVGPMIPDNNTPTGSQANTFCLWMGYTDSVFIGEAGPMHWMDEDGNILNKITSGASLSSPSLAQYVAYLEHFWQIGCYRRKSGAFANNVNMLVAA